jgi:16S rRNA processing protein RimM
MANANERKSYLAVGQIVGPHGIRGEVKVQPMTDFPERFKAGTTVFLGEGAGEVDARPIEIVSSRPNLDQVLVLFAGIKDRTAAEALRWQYVLIPEDEAMPLGEHENYLHDLIGLSVVTTDGQALGKLTEVVLTPANDVYVVRGEQGEVLVPATREVVAKVDLAARTMTVALPEGLLAPTSREDEQAGDMGDDGGDAS